MSETGKIPVYTLANSVEGGFFMIFFTSIPLNQYVPTRAEHLNKIIVGYS